MTEYIKVPRFATHDLLRGVEAISPFPRINSQQPRPEGYSRHAPGTADEKTNRDSRRFLALRRLIKKLQVAAQIIKVDFATADAELQRLGLAIVEDELIPQLLKLEIPPESIKGLLQQIARNPSSIGCVPARRMSAESPLFPVAAEGLSEYNLNIEVLKIDPETFGHKIVEEVNQEGLCIRQQNRLRLTFSRLDATSEAAKERLNLTISVLLGVVESDEADRRAILYPRGDKSYGLYADKRINLSI